VLARDALSIVALTPALEVVFSPMLEAPAGRVEGADDGSGSGDAAKGGADAPLLIEAIVRLRADVASNPTLLHAAAAAAGVAAAARPASNGAAAMDVDGAPPDNGAVPANGVAPTLAADGAGNAADADGAPATEPAAGAAP
jgi:hypothetical protein